MKTPVSRVCQLMALTLVAACCASVVAVAQDANVEPNVRARYAVLPQKPALPGAGLPTSNLQTWNGSFTSNGHQYNYVMVGTDPSTGSATLVQTFLIPVKIVLSTGQSFDPLGTTLQAPIPMTILSPIFDTTTTYTQGGVNVGTTQYVDAYQRANFWGTVKTHTSSHLLLGGPTVTAEQTLSPPSAYGTTGSPFGFT